MSPTQRPLPESIGRYRIELLLGSGGMGDVYKAFDPSLDRFVALKTINDRIRDDKVLDRLYREARACGRLDHPKIVRVYDVSEEHRFIAMEYLDGETLESAIQRQHLALHQQLRVLIDILDALSYAHAKGVIHRDIKPTNVFLLTSGELKLLDFGIARVAQTDSLTVTGTVMGTTYYMSPEQMKGLPVDERTDVYSTGVLAYELFTRRKPFEGNGITEVMLKVLSEQPPPMQTEWSGRFPELEQIVARAMTKSPLERFSSALEMKTQLLRFVEAHHAAIAGTSVQPVSAGTDRTVLLKDPHAASGSPLTVDTGGWQEKDAGLTSGTLSFPDGNDSHPRPKPAPVPPAPPAPQPVPSGITRMRKWLIPAAAIVGISVGAIVAAQIVLAPDTAVTPETPVIYNPPLDDPPPTLVDPPVDDPPSVDPPPVNPSPVDPNGQGQIRNQGQTAGGGRTQARSGVFIDRRQMDAALALYLDEQLRNAGLTIAPSAATAAWEISGRVDVTTRPAPFQGSSGITADYVGTLTFRNAATRAQTTARIGGNALDFGESVAREAALRRAAEEMAQAIAQRAGN